MLFKRKTDNTLNIEPKFDEIKNSFVSAVENKIQDIKSRKRLPIINEFKIIQEIAKEFKSKNYDDFYWFLEKLKEIKEKKVFKEYINDKRERQILKTLLTLYDMGLYAEMKKDIPEKIHKKINELLLESEEIVFILEGAWGTHERKTSSAVKVEGLFGPGAMMGRPYLILTNVRAIIYAKGLLTEDFRDFYYRDIVSVDFEKGLLFDSITIHAPGSIEKFEVGREKREQTLKAFEILKSKVFEAKNVQVSQQLKEDPIEKLKKLKELHELGILTDEEFEAKKKELLDKI